MTNKLHYFLNALGVGGTEKTAMLFAKHISQDFKVQVFTYADADLTRQVQFDNVVLLDRSAPDWSLVQDCDILHVFRSGYPEAPEPGVDVHVSRFIETNIFGFLDPSRRITKTLFMSKWLMDHALQGVVVPPALRGRFDFVNNPVEEPHTDASFRDALFPDSAIVLGRCGRPDNGIYNDVNVQAAKILREQGYDIHFFVVAPPSNMLADLERLNIPFRYLDPTTNPVHLSRFYNTIDILAHARADGETFGVNIAEAMMHGKPVVTHIATPSHPGMGVFQSQTELVDDGESGFVVQNDPVEYAEALKAIIDSPHLQQSMSYYAIAKAMKEYHVDVCVQKLESVYREITND